MYKSAGQFALNKGGTARTLVPLWTGVFLFVLFINKSLHILKEVIRMNSKVNDIKKLFDEKLGSVTTSEQVEELRVEFMGK